MLDKKLFDLEYPTQNRNEVLFLRECGIRYTYVKTDTEIPIYKYTKTPELFDALRLYYKSRTQ